MSGNSKDLRLVKILVFVAAFSFFAADRFYRITEIGMDGGDTFTYLNIAADWLEGDVTLTEHYRPLLYLLFTTALKIFGTNDYAIKILNAFLDMLTILVIFLAARKLSKNFLVSIAACALYALLPGPLIFAARSELVHASTTLFVTAGLYTFTFYYRTGKIEKSPETYLLVASGFLLGCAANTHPEVVLVGPAMILLLLRAHAVHDNLRLSQTLFACGLFTLAFFVPFICAGLYFGFGVTIEGFFTNYRDYDAVASPRFVYRLLMSKEIAQRYFSEFSSNIMKYVFAESLAVNVILYKVCSRRSAVGVFLLPMLFHFFGYCVFSPQFKMARLFLPWLPYIMLYICYWLHELVAVLIVRKRIIPVVFLALWAALAVYHRITFPEALPVTAKIDTSKSVLVSAQQEVSAYREVHDVLEGRYGEKKRVLLTPLALRDVKDMLEKKPYFASAGRYLSRSRYPSLDMTITGYEIKYMIVFKAKLNTKKIKRDDFNVLTRRFYGIGRHEYSIRRELALLEEYARERGARLIYESNRASIYEFPVRAPMSSGG